MTPILHSPPVDLEWYGWRATTHSLANAGWDISQHVIPQEMSLELVVRSPDTKIIGLGDRVNYSRYILPNDYRYAGMEPMRIHMQLAGNIRIIGHHAMTHRGVRYHPIDPYPWMQEYEEIDLRQISLFRSLPESAPDIIIPEPTIDNVLNQLLDLQAPKQKEIRAKRREEESRIIKPNVGAIIRVAA